MRESDTEGANAWTNTPGPPPAVSSRAAKTCLPVGAGRVAFDVGVRSGRRDIECSSMSRRRCRAEDRAAPGARRHRAVPSALSSTALAFVEHRRREHASSALTDQRAGRRPTAPRPQPRRPRSGQQCPHGRRGTARPRGVDDGGGHIVTGERPERAHRLPETHRDESVRPSSRSRRNINAPRLPGVSRYSRIAVSSTYVT